MNMRALITGGAGFIGSHLAAELLEHGYHVRVLDSLVPQVHGSSAARPDYLHPDVELVVRDVRDAEGLRSALKGVDAVFHFAAAVGVGQSMYEVEKYVSTNCIGTSVLLEALMNQPVRRLIVASSMSVYGEGLYAEPNGSTVTVKERGIAQLRAHDWELRDDSGQVLSPVPTPETKVPALTSVYALTKYDQERLCMMIGRSYGIATVGLRFFNVFGTHQALSNPYTGVLAIFASRLLNGKPPLIFEDGYQQRDFVSVLDVARACRLALEVPQAAGEVLNIGSGRAYTIRQVAERMASAVGKPEILPEITGKYRVGDIRHCYADISRARQVLGYAPQVSLETGLVELADWLEGQQAADRAWEARQELDVRGLAI